MKNIIILASGSGSNAENIINFIEKDKTAFVSCVLCNNPNAFVIQRAQKLRVPVHLFTKEEFVNGSVLGFMKGLHPDLIVLAGFLWLIPQPIIQEYPNRIINIHPALLPKYGGKGMYGQRVHQSVIDNHESSSGITIHFVNEHYDDGAIIFQAQCSVEPNDNADNVAEKVHELEYAHFPIVIKNILDSIQ